MDKERRKKLQTTKLIITEIFMLVTIIVTVVILTFIVMGYRLTEDGKLEQSGLVGVDSIPTGATVFVDGEAYESKTNTSKILPEGQYEISLEKDGYTSWRKSVLVHSGLLTKLSYPHLYKTDRKTETVKSLDIIPSIFSVSPDRNTIVFGPGSSDLQLLNIDSSEPKSIALEFKDLLKSATELKILSWSKSNERLIASFTKDDSTHYAILDLEHPNYSLDITETFGLKITGLSFLNDNGDRLLVLEENHLRLVSLSDKQLSNILIKDVLSFTNFGTKIAVVTKSPGAKIISLYDYSNDSTVPLIESSAENVFALVSEYLGRFTFATIEDKILSIYRGDLPIDSKESLKDPVGKIDLSFIPTTLETRGKEQVIVTSSGADFTVFDLENYNFSSYTLENNLTFWPDDYTIGLVADESLLFRDFDGQNPVRLSSAETGFPAAITKDNKYLYFIQKTTDKNLAIVREVIK